ARWGRSGRCAGAPRAARAARAAPRRPPPRPRRSPRGEVRSSCPSARSPTPLDRAHQHEGTLCVAMSAEGTVAPAPLAPLWGELRYSGELVRLLADGRLRSPRRAPSAPPVMLIPGFMAGDASLTVLRQWLRRRGHRVATSGMLANVDCAERAVGRLEGQLRSFAVRCGRP